MGSELSRSKEQWQMRVTGSFDSSRGGSLDCGGGALPTTVGVAPSMLRGVRGAAASASFDSGGGVGGGGGGGLGSFDGVPNGGGGGFEGRFLEHGAAQALIERKGRNLMGATLSAAKGEWERRVTGSFDAGGGGGGGSGPRSFDGGTVGSFPFANRSSDLPTVPDQRPLD